MQKKDIEEQGLSLGTGGEIIGNFNKAIDKYSSVTSEELLEFLGTLDEDTKTE